MPDIFSAKLRKIGSSVGVLLPKEELDALHVDVGDEVEIAILKHRKIEDVRKAFGMSKGSGEFERDKTTRVFD